MIAAAVLCEALKPRHIGQHCCSLLAHATEHACVELYSVGSVHQVLKARQLPEEATGWILNAPANVSLRQGAAAGRHERRETVRTANADCIDPAEVL